MFLNKILSERGMELLAFLVLNKASVINNKRPYILKLVYNKKNNCPNVKKKLTRRSSTI